MKQLITPLFFAFLLSLFLSGCDKFDLDFTTKSKFNLNASSHELDVKTKQDRPDINAIVINGKKTYLWPENGLNEEYMTRDYNGFSVKYQRYGYVEEIIGEWFNISRVDDYTVHISIAKNETQTDRSLNIELFWRTAYNHIDIKQSK